MPDPIRDGIPPPSAGSARRRHGRAPPRGIVPLVLRATRLSKVYATPSGEVRAVTEFDHLFTPGCVTAVVGPSGSGKSTLLNLLAGFDTPTTGEVWIGDDPVHALPERERSGLRLRRFGFVFQSFNLVAVLSAEQNVALPLGLAGVARAERHRRARALLARFGLTARADHLPHRLSGGERQRVALARALANDPDVVFADEPTGALDSASGALVMDALAEVADEGRTVVLVTHDPTLAGRAHEHLRLRDGSLVEATTRSAPGAALLAGVER
jgi:putative ABC transport system ATP-binding protein